MYGVTLNDHGFLLGDVITWTNECIGPRIQCWHYCYTDSCLVDFWFEEELSKSMFILRWSEYIV